MTRSIPLLTALALTACAKSDPPPPAADDPATGMARDMPAPLPQRAFEMPPSTSATLSNGLTVTVVENHEVPTFEARLALRLPADADPDGLEGATSLLFDLMDEGAGGRDAVALGRALKQLGGSLSSGSGADRASVRVAGPVRNLEPLLDLWVDVLLRPDLDEDEWDVLQTRRVADLAAAYDNPGSVASRVGSRIVFGDTYTGDLATPDTLKAVSLTDLAALHDTLVRPDRAVLFLGGDLTLDEVVPALEARLADWAAPSEPPSAPPTGETTAFEAETVYLVDMPGAAQSVIRAFHPVPDRRSDDWWPLYMANTVFGGAFTARVNMDLREDKGWTYGARCGLSDHAGDALWYCATNVQTDKSAPALDRLRTMLAEAMGDRPVSEDELTFFTGYRVNGFYGSYETPSALLGELVDQWLHGLPDDWLERYVPSVEAVDVAAANTAFTTHLDPNRVAWLVVGDLATIQSDIEAFGLPTVVLDAEGRPVEESP